MTPLTLEILDDTGRLGPEKLKYISTNAAAAVHKLNATGELRVRVVGDEAMAAAHEEFAGVPGTTDVLTFDMSDPMEGAEGENPEVWVRPSELESGYERAPFVLDTDILICHDEGSRQAAARGYAVERELLLYIVHGVLHCLGYDDHDDDSFGAMHDMEDAVLTAIGVGPTFGPRHRGS